MAAKEQRRTIKIPPVIDDIEDELRDLLLNPERLSIHKWKGSRNVWPREVDMSSIFYCQDVPVQAGLQPIRNTNGQIVDWKEVVNYQSNKREDLSMKRPPLPPHLATQGMPNQLPFLPAGYEIDPNENLLLQDTKNDLFDEEEDAPGSFMGEKLMCNLSTDDNNFEGLFFDDDGVTLIGEEVNVKKHIVPNEDDINLTNTTNGREEIDFKIIINKDNHLIGFWSDSEEQNSKQKKENLSSKSKTMNEDESLLEECIIQPIKTVPDLPVLQILNMEDKSVLGVTEWAEMLDVTKPVEDFEQRIPQMAHTFPFELDTFQKQAILKLEEQGHVFVAAHTSAGKTVVAEYAIALSKRHFTRTVYTSPIKALSNQKYKDFSRTFGDVGLITGDLQINTTASCLVMTTEILRSMLYRGSDVVRDLEYVIFDEVHYINDAERGYVWEEVLILLPPHVSIVMLSATVPNTLEFADWVGRTKRRKVYVVSTYKRPVPLCHYLYTGSSGSSKDERFLIVNQDGVFIQKGFEMAIQKKKDRASAFKKDFGPKGTRNFLTPNQEQTMWVAFISHLQKHSLLPVVAFVLSRNRCDKTAEALRSIDLTTAREKGRIHCFIQTCLKRLKEPDRKLPQILRMQSILACGIGVHHSGILPILKEIVEMLFANGLVKILFATETFAMGVNMPARTVVFDSVSKFDGLEMRHLLPAEYIQMAGRAGRRGLDATGAVIILCKKDVPDSLTLKTMMQGKPMRLSSQFRVTYSTMLSLLRATSVSVESVMQRSFREFGEQCKAEGYKKELEEVLKIIELYAEDPLPPHLAALAEFHNVAADYLQEMSDLMPVLLEQTTKYILPGRIIAISIGKYVNQLAMCLNFQGPRSTPYKVLILDTENQDTDEQTPAIEKTDIWYSMCGLARGLDRIGSDQTTLKHLVICVGSKNIIGVTTLHFRFDFSLIVADYEKRQIARFRSNLPGSTCKDAVMKLSQLSFVAFNKTKQIEFINLRDGLKIYNGEILHSIERVDALKKHLQDLLPATNIANFEKEFAIVFERKQVERKYIILKRLVSYEAMALYPDYQRRLEVLKELNYVDDQNRVAMKGRVACEMKTNELIITELVFRNILTDLEPAKIAALLSCLVFQARTQSETPIEKSLLKSINAIKDVDMELSKVEEKFMVGVDDPACLAERLNFGLVQVVYEWAKGKPFADIIDLTDVQEGIIVRNIQQLHEVLMNVRDAAKIIGDPMLHAKMEEVSLVIKRDIVFFASLYTQDDVISV